MSGESRATNWPAKSVADRAGRGEESRAMDSSGKRDQSNTWGEGGAYLMAYLSKMLVPTDLCVVSAVKQNMS